MTSYAVEIVINGRDNASGPLRGVGGALGNIAQIASGILSAQVFTRIAQGIADMGRDALASTASWERMGMAMTSMVTRELMHADATLTMADAMVQANGKAQDLLTWIQNLAIASPFDAESIGKSYRQALTYGFTSEQAQNLTQVLVDMSAGMGLTGSQIEHVSYALGQINQNDKLLMQDLYQLINVGVPVNDILAKMGYSLGDVGKEAIDSKKFLEEFTTLMGGDFEGAAKRQAESWAGLANSLSDIKSIGLREFFSSTFESIQPYVADFVAQFADEDFKNNLREMGKPLGEFVGSAVSVLSKLSKVKSITGLAATFSDLIPPGMRVKLYGITLEIDGFIQKIKDIKSPGDVFNFLKDIIPFDIFGPLLGLLDSVGGFFVEQGPGIAASGKQIFDSIFQAVDNLVTKMTPFIGDILDKLATWITANGPLIAAFMQGIADFFTNVVAPAISNLWMVIGPLLSGIVDLLLGFVTLIMQLATGDWAGAWQTIQNIAVGVWDTIKSTILGIFNWIFGFFGTSMAELQEVWSKNWEQFGEIVGKLKDIIVKKVVQFVTAGRMIVDGIKLGITGAWNNIVNTLTGLIGELIESVMKALGIASPSRVFMGIGSNMVLGMARGIMAQSANVQGAMAGVLSGTMQAGTSGFASQQPGYGAPGGGNETINNYGPVYAQGDSRFRDNILANSRRRY